MRNRQVELEITERIHAHLRNCFAEAGLGSIVRTERAIAPWIGYFRDKRRKGSLQVSMLVLACYELGIRPGKLLDEALGESEYDDESEHNSLPHASWKGAKTIRNRMLEEAGDD